MKQSTATHYLVFALVSANAGIAPDTAAGALRLPQSAFRLPAARCQQSDTKPTDTKSAGTRQDRQPAVGDSTPPASASVREQPRLRRDTTVTLNHNKYDLSQQQDWEAFQQTVQTLREQAKAEKKEKKEQKAEEKEERTKKKEKAEKKEEKKKEKSNRDWSSKKVRAGLDALNRVAKQVQEGTQEREAGIHTIQEISWAIESNFRTPYTWRPSVDLGDFLFRASHLMLNGCGRGSRKDPATNLAAYDTPDLSLVNPLPSTFWSPPGNIAAKDLYAGFGRPAPPDFSQAICEYDSPHKGYGVHPSFEVTQNDRPWKVKFGDERSSEPFACRIFWALGFPVNVVDYAPLVKVRWDRRILSDFNSRKLNATELKLAGISLGSLHKDRYSNPFDYIRYAIMKDGSRQNVDALRQGLFPVKPGHSRPRHPEQKSSLYDTGFEEKIDYLVMQAASFSSKETEKEQEVGNWDYNYLEHPKRREVRGMAVLDAWLENYDMRWGNNELHLVESPDGIRLEHVVSDLGGIFGQSSGILRTRRGGFAMGLYGNAPNEYGWACTHPQAAGKTTAPIRDYMPATRTDPFYQMNLDDARWMARLIAQLTEPQIKAALIGAGYDAPVARILLEKLVSRRDRMIADFGLSGEIAPLRPNGINERLSYTPATDAPFELTLTDGRKIAAQDSGEMLLINGLLKPNPHFQRK